MNHKEAIESLTNVRHYLFKWLDKSDGKDFMDVIGKMVETATFIEVGITNPTELQDFIYDTVYTAIDSIDIVVDLLEEGSI
jgi:hypothetical protein